MFSYPHHIGDFIRDTSRLSDSQCMTYLRLMWLYYETEQSLPDDVQLLAFKTGSDEKTVAMLLQCYFYANALRWHHKRIDSEIETYKNKSKKASESAKSRWKNAKAMRTHSDRNADGMLTDNREPITKEKNISAVAPSQPQAAVTIPDPPDKLSRKPRSAGQADMRAELVNRGCTEQEASDFLKLRTAQRAPLTATAIAGIEREAIKANFTFPQAIAKCVERNWRGFEAAWVMNQARASPRSADSLHEQNAANIAAARAKIFGSNWGEVIEHDRV